MPDCAIRNVCLTSSEPITFFPNTQAIDTGYLLFCFPIYEKTQVNG